MTNRPLNRQNINTNHQSNTNEKILSIAVLAGALSLSSCSYLECALSANPKECAIGKAIDQAVETLANTESLKNAADADKIASKWGTIQTTMSTAQSLGVKIPTNARTSYNKFILRAASKNYFGSQKLRTAMGNARML